MIFKTLALKQYRLKPQHLDGLLFTKKRSVFFCRSRFELSLDMLWRSTVVSGYRHDMFLYNEREVERRAWECHGGPEGFDA